MKKGKEKKNGKFKNEKVKKRETEKKKEDKSSVSLGTGKQLTLVTPIACSDIFDIIVNFTIHIYIYFYHSFCKLNKRRIRSKLTSKQCLLYLILLHCYKSYYY